MAVSRIGTGWSVEDRDFATIAAWNSARGGSGEFEEGILRGSVTTGNTNINGAFSAGALLHGFVQYDGSNEVEIATTGGNHNITLSAANVIVRDLRILYSNNFAFSVTVSGNNSFFERCRLVQNGTGNAGTVNLNNVATNKGLRKCVVSGNGNLNYIQTGFNRDFVIEDCTGWGYASSTIPTTVGGGDSSKILVNCFFLDDTGSTYADPSFYTDFDNNASLDSTGSVTGYGPDEFVDFAGGDLRIKSTSDLVALGIGAFFEEGLGGEPEVIELTPNPAEQRHEAEQASLTLWQALAPSEAETRLEAEQAELTGAFYALVPIPAEIVLQAEQATLTGAFHQLTSHLAELRHESEQQSLDVPTGLQSIPAEQRHEAEQASLTLWQALAPAEAETRLEAEQGQLIGAFYQLVAIPAELVIEAEQGSLDAPIALQSIPAKQRHEAEQGSLTLWQALVPAEAETRLEAKQAELTGAFYQLVAIPAEMVTEADQGSWPDLHKPLDVSRIQLIRTTQQFQLKRTTMQFNLVKH